MTANTRIFSLQVSEVDSPDVVPVVADLIHTDGSGTTDWNVSSEWKCIDEAPASTSAATNLTSSTTEILSFAPSNQVSTCAVLSAVLVVATVASWR